MNLGCERNERSEARNRLGITNSMHGGTTLWSIRNDGRTLSAEVHFVAGDVEIRLLMKDRGSTLGLWGSRTFPDGDEAIRWSDQQLTSMLRSGWVELRVVRKRPT